MLQGFDKVINSFSSHSAPQPPFIMGCEYVPKKQTYLLFLKIVRICLTLESFRSLCPRKTVVLVSGALNLFRVFPRKLSDPFTEGLYFQTPLLKGAGMHVQVLIKCLTNLQLLIRGTVCLGFSKSLPLPVAYVTDGVDVLIQASLKCANLLIPMDLCTQDLKICANCVYCLDNG
jgi:hypothetical protein